ncbi:uncharacterized protein LOC116618005 isoform X1 [Nematostella vectensis]|uniref:uncharacterized protein LOC116618005 isoform X1 n=1 Tax=Nematostella vectensis TaxID=45351 RepID=UPI001390412D|nr:uncharacterized protein LOC116618005 isoform X1 [Nematostella vectensis]
MKFTLLAALLAVLLVTAFAELGQASPAADELEVSEVAKSAPDTETLEAQDTEELEAPELQEATPDIDEHVAPEVDDAALDDEDEQVEEPASDTDESGKTDLNDPMIDDQDADKEIELQARGPKKEYKPWSAWQTWSVPQEITFPDYKQFTVKGAKCPVGCGPVAWAMVFGYYDRLAHTSSSYGYSKHLFRCYKGVAGSPNCIAPKYQNPTVQDYILAINKELKTFCLFGGGATTPKGMGRIQKWYQARQGKSATISSYKYWLSWTGITRTWIRNKARDAIKAKYPAIVGIWVKGKAKSQHYAVATKYTTRYRKWRRCIKIWKKICGKWHTQRQESFYLHMGWGGYKNNWYNIKTFSAFVARK